MADDDSLVMLPTEQTAETAAIRGAALLGAMIGLLSCAATRAGNIWYARATLPNAADMGERLAVGLPILISAGIVFSVSLVLTVIIVAQTVRRVPLLRPRSLLKIGGSVAGAVLIWLAFSSSGFLFDLALVGLWTGIHGLFASTRGKF